MTHQLYTGGMTHIYVFFYQFVEYMFSLGHAKIKRRNNAAILVSWMGGERGDWSNFGSIVTSPDQSET